LSSEEQSCDDQVEILCHFTRNRVANFAPNAITFGFFFHGLSIEWITMPIKLDAIDRRILTELQRDARLQNTELAQRVGLSPSPCLRRVRILEESGVIACYVALLAPAAVDLKMTIFVRVTLDRQDKQTVEHFAKVIQSVPEVLECHLMAGSYDYLLRVVARDLDDYQRFQMEHLTRIKGVRNVETEIPLKRIKQTTEMPLA
jgi:Lrp/AsnC family transcriptional regulator, leucine-responsive regulatory protein